MLWHIYIYIHSCWLHGQLILWLLPAHGFLVSSFSAGIHPGFLRLFVSINIFLKACCTSLFHIQVRRLKRMLTGWAIISGCLLHVLKRSWWPAYMWFLTKVSAIICKWFNRRLCGHNLGGFACEWRIRVWHLVVPQYSVQLLFFILSIIKIFIYTCCTNMFYRYFIISFSHNFLVWVSRSRIF